MELSAVDPEQGAMFYTLDQTDSPKTRPVRRTDDCWQCHATPATMGVPGHMVRSLLTAPDGTPLIATGGFLSDHRSPLKDRWGGWYVTGTSGQDGVHMGNLLVRAADDKSRLDFAKGSNVTDLTGRLNLARYPSPHSDLVALMVMEHQARLQNLLALTGREASPKRVEELVRYMLFADEAKLAGPLKGTSDFAREFSRRGPRDRHGRSLRDLDLTRRMFRYPCSYLIYSPAFDGLPEPALALVYRRLWEVLRGGVGGYERLTAEDRRAVTEILLATKADFAKARPASP